MTAASALLGDFMSEGRGPYSARSYGAKESQKAILGGPMGLGSTSLEEPRIATEINSLSPNVARFILTTEPAFPVRNDLVTYTLLSDETSLIQYSSVLLAGEETRKVPPKTVFAEGTAEISLFGDLHPLEGNEGVSVVHTFGGKWRVVGQGQGSQFLTLSQPLLTAFPSETVTPAAENFAKARGLYGSFVLAKQIVYEKVPSLSALYVDVEDDRDEGGYPTLCFIIATQDSVEHVLEIDNALQISLYERIPPDDRLFITLAFRFE